MPANKMIRSILIVVLLVTFSGCANRAVVDRHKSFNLESIKSLHIKNSDGGGDELIPVIESKLREMGYSKITIGDDVSPSADAVITYKDKWMWDLTMYMVELTITVRDKQSWTPLATGNSMHSSFSRKSEKEMVGEVLTNLFSKTEHQ